MKFRQASATDFNRLLFGYRDIVENMEKRPFEEKYRKQRLKTAIAKGQNLVAEQDGCLVGFIEYNTTGPDLPLLRDAGSAWIDWVWVDAAYRGKGVGKALYAHAFAHLKQRGFVRVGTDAFSVNENSQRFHEKVGFTETMRIYMKDL